MRAAIVSGLLIVAACGSDAQTTGDAGADGASSGIEGGTANLAQLCVDTINMYRATLNLPPLGRLGDIEACADSQAKSDAMSGKDHGAFGQCGELAQNECPNWPGPPETMIKNCLALMWAEGPGTDFTKHGHYINMSSPKYVKVACGFHKTSTGRYWSVQDFR